MGRSVIGLCALGGMTLGGFVPDLWGASSLSMASMLLSVVGGVFGIWVGVRLNDA